MYLFLFFTVFIVVNCSSPSPPQASIISDKISPQKKNSPQVSSAAVKEELLADDIIWTNPDTPGVMIPRELFSGSRQRPWCQSLKLAQRLSYVNACPLLLWFTDAHNNTACQSLAKEVFDTLKFKEWSPSNIVKLRIDTTHPQSKALKERFHVLGQPVVLLISPNHSIIDRYGGFQRGKGVLYQTRLIKAVEGAKDDCLAWKESMQRKGYLLLTGKNKNQIFGKIVSVTEETILLVEPNGEETITHMSNLSRKDQNILQRLK